MLKISLSQSNLIHFSLAIEFMNVIHLSAECYPVAKVGGLGDVLLGALPRGIFVNQEPRL